MSDHKIKVGVTLGDINGIGPEVVVKTFSDIRITEICTPVIYGSSKVINFYKKTIPGCENFSYAIVSSARDAKPKRINLVNCIDDEVRIEPGEATTEAGRAAVQALKACSADIHNGSLDVMVTGPINKNTVQSDTFRFTGHTEYLASEFKGEPLMTMCSETMKVGLVSIHVPVSQIPAHITRETILSAIGKIHHTLVNDFGCIEPRIAVLALNPHSGDGGLLGDEEQKIISPTIAEAFNSGKLVFGPYASDGFFASGLYRKYDAVLAMYHDQGLTPFKALTPEGVNFTAGLSVIRTSPDHGVAYDIAGKNLADASSMRSAIYLATDIWRARNAYKEMTKNPLKHYERERGADISVRDLIPEQEAD